MVQPQLNLSYDPAIPGRKFDFFPANADSAPLLAMFHGGGWISGDRAHLHEEAEWFASQGINVASVGYRLAPLHPFPDPIADIQEFMRFAKANAKDLNTSGTQTISFGVSAGGHLACMAGLCDKAFRSEEDVVLADGVVSICAITDLRNPEETQFPIAFSFLDQFIQEPHALNPEPWAEASPVTYVKEEAPPFLIFHGTADDVVPVKQAQILHSALNQVGSPSELHLLESEGHSFMFDTWNHMRQQIVEFVRTI
ncbi:MAG: alpha/beta hydrolase [Armatimonadetes bacterium]|nr:alpha/beta hydrolase [Armatimonadota bacterium]